MALKTVIIAIVTPFNPVVEFFSKTLSAWMALFGLLAVIVGAIDPFGLDEKYLKLFNSIGSAVLVGGVFGVLLKSLQYSEVFKTELSKVIYEDQFLQKRNDLQDLWLKISIAVYNTRYPAISGAIAETVTKDYFPTDDTFYYEKFDENISLSLLGPDNKYVETTEIITLCVKPIDPSKPVDWCYAAKLHKDPSDTTRTQFKCEKIEVGEKDLTSAYPVETLDAADGRAKEARVQIKLQGASEYNLRLKVRKIYDYELNRQRDMKSQRFINKPVFRVEYDPKELELEFVPIGTREDAYNPRGRGMSHVIWNEYQRLLFPNQGYRLLLRRR